MFESGKTTFAQNDDKAREWTMISQGNAFVSLAYIYLQRTNEREREREENRESVQILLF